LGFRSGSFLDQTNKDSNHRASQDAPEDLHSLQCRGVSLIHLRLQKPRYIDNIREYYRNPQEERQVCHSGIIAAWLCQPIDCNIDNPNSPSIFAFRPAILHDFRQLTSWNKNIRTQDAELNCQKYCRFIYLRGVQIVLVLAAKTLSSHPRI